MNIDLEIKQYLDLLSAEQKSAALNLLKKFVPQNDVSSLESSILQYNMELEAAVERIKGGDYLTHEQLLKEAKEW